MEKSYVPDKVRVAIRKTPVLTLFLQIKYVYKLSDFSYGEWLIFQNGFPKYYLNIFDTYYKEVKFEELNGIEKILIQKFKSGDFKLTFNNKYIGLCLDSKAKVEDFQLEKLPIRFFTTR